MKIGDLVRVKGMAKDGKPMLGVITDLSEPTPRFPYQVATIMHDNGIVEGLLPTLLEVVNDASAL